MNETIVFEEVTGIIVEFRRGVWWPVLSERLNIWRTCYNLFLKHSYPAKLAATFFLDLLSKLEHELFVREQAMLLCYANELLKQCSLDSSEKSKHQISMQSN